jgi:hypothetical protein
MSVVFLIIAITHAFPSADQSFHVTMFLIVVGIDTDNIWGYRPGGGILGTLLSLFYYHGYYNNMPLYTFFEPKPEAVVVEPRNISNFRMPGLSRRL